MIKVSLKELREAIKKKLRSCGYPEKQLPILLQVIFYGVERGNMQFIIQTCAQGIQPFHAKRDLETVYETPLSMRINGHDNYGIVVMEHSMQVAIEKASKSGFGIVGSFRSAPPGTGALGYYVEHIARAGLIGFAFSGSSKKVAIQDSPVPVFGSNPIAVGFPTEDRPIVLDFATSAMPIFKVVEALLYGESLPIEGYDAQGNLSADPARVLKGALTPFGGYKGSALALIVEALTGPLVGASWLGKGDIGNDWGNLIFAIDPGLLIEKPIFYQNISHLADSIRNSSAANLPGDKAWQTLETTLEKGCIEMDPRLYEKWVLALKET